MIIDLKNLTIKKAHEALVAGDFTAVDLTRACLDTIKSKDGEINAYREVFTDAIDQACEADRDIAKLKQSVGRNIEKAKNLIPMLMGIPCAIKDNILFRGHGAGASSKILENYTATYDATVVAKLREQGAVIIGRTNMDEFAMGGSTENSAYGPTRNPHDISRVAGGSSGGSAAALAMNSVLFTLGSDTGGSIRQPASFCGVVGLKPTYGSVSRYGVMAMGSSLDQIGPFAKNVEDCQFVFDAIKGQDINDGTTISPNTYSPNRLGKSKPTIGLPRHFLKGDGLDPVILENFEKTLENLRAKGYEIKEISLPNISYALMVYYIIMPAEVSSNMARFDGVKYGLHVDGRDMVEDYFKTRGTGLGREVIRRILLGTYVLSSGYYNAYYNRANVVRRMITEDFIKAFEDVDVIVTPTAPSPAFKIGEKIDDPVSMYLEDIFTVTANLTGMPAVSVPSGLAPIDEDSGRTKELPIGIQFTARHGDEESLFKVGGDVLK